MEMVPIAKFKVAWFEDGKTVHSAMFDTHDDALKFAKIMKQKGNIVTLMELKHADTIHRRYDWIVHAFDVGDALHWLAIIYRHKLWIALGLGAFFAHRSGKKK